MMIIGIWIIMVICIVVVLGEIKYRYFDTKETLRENKAVSKDWKDNVDTDLDKFSMEHTNDEFVSSQVLAMRGSWRLAQNHVMGGQTFRVLRSEEYSKML